MGKSNKLERQTAYQGSCSEAETYWKSESVSQPFLLVIWLTNQAAVAAASPGRSSICDCSARLEVMLNSAALAFNKVCRRVYIVTLREANVKKV